MSAHTDHKKLEKIFLGEKVEIVRSSGEAIELTLGSTQPAVTLVIVGQFELTFWGNRESVIATDTISFRPGPEAEATHAVKLKAAHDGIQSVLEVLRKCRCADGHCACLAARDALANLKRAIS